jgi:uncharacterized protein (DUF1778 family)
MSHQNTFAACREAEQVLCDRRYFILDEESFNAF